LDDSPITDISPLVALTELAFLAVTNAYLYLGPGSPAAATITALETGGTYQTLVVDDPQNEPGDQMSLAYDMGSFGVSDVTRLDSQQIGDGPYGNADVDLYAITLDQAGSVEIDVDAQAIGSGLDAYLRLFNDAGVEVASDDNTHGSDPYLTPALAAGTYYVGVSGAPNGGYDPTAAGTGTNGTTTGAYELRVIKGTDAPNAPDLQSASDTGQADDDNITMLDNSSPAQALTFDVGGTLPGAVVALYAGTTRISDFVVASSAMTTLTTNGSHDLTDGPHAITAKQDVSGRIPSINSPPLDIIIDATPPTADVPNLAPGSDSGQFTDDDITKGTTPQFTGTADDGPGSGIWKVEVNSNDGKSGTDDTADFYDVVLPTLDEGNWTVSATAYDVAGNTFTTGTLPVTVDRTAPTADVPNLADASDTGKSSTDNVTKGTNPQFTGAVNDANGVWGVHIIPDVGEKVVVITGGPVYDGVLPTLDEGTRTVSATAYDVAGNTFTTGNLTVTVDRTAPTADVPDLAPGSDTGQSSTDDNTQGTTPQFTGTADDGTGSGIWKVEVDSNDGKSGTDDAAGFYEVVLPTLDEGTRTVSATAYDVAGNTFTTDNLPVTVDRTGPQVAQVYAVSTAWGASFFGVGALDDANGWFIPDGAGQLDPLPWMNVNQFKIVLSEDAIIDNDDLGITGVNVPTYETVPLDFAYDVLSYTAAWKLTNNVTADKLRLVLSDSVADAAGNALDGGDFDFRVNVVPGDVNQSDKVTFQDYITVRVRNNALPGEAEYSVLYDVNGSGKLTFQDYIAVRIRNNDELPDGEPAAALVPQQALTVLPASDAGQSVGSTRDPLTSTAPLGDADVLSSKTSAILGVSPAGAGGSEPTADRRRSTTDDTSVEPSEAQLVLDLTTGLTDPLTGENL